jgi:putative intracellular protease/amidase
MASVRCATVLLASAATAATVPFCRNSSDTPLPDVGDVLERPCAQSRQFQLSGRRALIVTTSHDRLCQESEECEATGVTLEEADIPYFIYQDAGLKVDVASIKGGRIPEDGNILSHWDCRLKHDAEAYSQFQQSLAVADVNFSAYDIVYMAGGWGASWDLPTSEALGKGITEAFLAGKLLGSVCHGGLGFVNARKADGSLLVNGTRMTAVTDRQIDFLSKSKGWHEPHHPEAELRKRGAVYEAHHGIMEITASDVVVDDLTSDGRIITGQNQNSACGVAQAHLARLESDANESFSLTFVGCKANVVGCYQGLYSDLSELTKVDPFVLVCSKHLQLTAGTCAAKGYPDHIKTFFGNEIVKDPVFRKTTVWVAGKTILV